MYEEAQYGTGRVVLKAVVVQVPFYCMGDIVTNTGTSIGISWRLVPEDRKEVVVYLGAN
jgi:hypothetical protein